MTEKDLEKRLTKIEEYITCCEKTKEDEWKCQVVGRLYKIEEKIESIEKRQRNAAWHWIFGFGVSAMAVGISWLLSTTTILPGDWKSGLFVFVAGIIICLLSPLTKQMNRS